MRWKLDSMHRLHILWMFARSTIGSSRGIIVTRMSPDIHVQTSLCNASSSVYLWWLHPCWLHINPSLHGYPSLPRNMYLEHVLFPQCSRTLCTPTCSLRHMFHQASLRTHAPFARMDSIDDDFRWWDKFSLHRTHLLTFHSPIGMPAVGQNWAFWGITSRARNLW